MVTQELSWFLKHLRSSGAEVKDMHQDAGRIMLTTEGDQSLVERSFVAMTTVSDGSRGCDAVFHYIIIFVLDFQLFLNEYSSFFIEEIKFILKASW